MESKRKKRERVLASPVQEERCRNGHDFVPGVDMDDPDHPSNAWCNVCGEARRPVSPVQEGAEDGS